MEESIILAGPTLDRALGLVRLGLLSSEPTSIASLEPRLCVGSSRKIKALVAEAPDRLKALLIPSPSNVVHVYVAQETKRYACASIAHHLCSSRLPSGSFMRICDGVLAPSWELYFLLKCRAEQRLAQRLLIGMELCGGFSHLIACNESSETFYKIPRILADGTLLQVWKDPNIEPATSAEKLRAYLAQCGGVKGAQAAREAQRFILDRSRSPNESILALMAMLPCRMGGYGFKGLVLNPKIEVPKEKRHLTREDHYYPDGLYAQLETDLEYESNERHVGKAAVAKDKARRNDIQALGIEVKDVTWEMLSHLGSLNLVFDQLLDKEKRLGLDRRGAHARAVHHLDIIARRRVLLNELLPSWPYEP